MKVTIFGEGNGTPLQYSCLENPVDGGAWWAAVHGVTKSQTQLSDFTSLRGSPAISAYSAVRGAPDRHLRSTVSHFISDYQSLDQHLSAA